MPRFYFHTRNGHVERDDVGTELASLAEGRSQAVRLAGEILRERPDVLGPDRSWTMTVTDDQDLTLFTIEVIATNAPAAGGR